MLEVTDVFEIKNLPFTVSSDGAYLYKINRIDLVPVAQKFYDSGFVHLSTIVGYEFSKEQLILNYYLYNYKTENFLPEIKTTHLPVTSVVLSIEIPYNNPEVPSICSVYNNASVYERELVDIFGISFKGTDYIKNEFLFNESYPKNFYPLRKDSTGLDLKKKLDTLNIIANKPKELCENQFDYTFSIGPQHPTNKEPVRFQFYVEGEHIKDVAFRIGFNHRGIEKAIEMNNWTQNLYLIERICGICSGAHQVAYVTTAEKIGKYTQDIPERANYLRVLILELERIHSHILWYGVLAHDAGFDLMFQLTWRDRELVMDILEKLSGNRVNYSYQTIGGVRRDINIENVDNALRDLKVLRNRVEEHYKILENEKSFTERLKNIGYLSYKDAVKYNAVGPCARSTGIKFDARKNEPYAAYKNIPFTIYTRNEGDIYSNLLVRLDETLESIDMCIYVLENLPKGDISIKVKPRLPEGEATSRIEAPRGEDMHYIRSAGGTNPDRYKVRAPTLANIPSLIERFKGMQIADIPMIIRSIDPCIGCMERVTFIKDSTGKSIDITGKELIMKAQRKYKLNESIKLF